MLHPYHYFTNLESQAEDARIRAILSARADRMKASESKPRPMPPLPPRETASQMKDYQFWFFAQPDWCVRLSDATAREHTLEQLEKQLLDTVANPPADLSKSEIEDLKVKILGRDFKSARSTSETTVTEHENGKLDRVREELAEIRKNLQVLVMRAEWYLLAKQHLPSDWEVNKARDAERALEDLIA